MNGELKQWLQEQPLEEPVEIDGEVIYLTVRDDGAELGAYLLENHSLPQLENAMRNGFRSATMFDAGLGLTADGKVLVLNQWLPRVSSWPEAAQSLENLLNQLGEWRADLTPETSVTEKVTARTEQRLRSLFKGATS